MIQKPSSQSKTKAPSVLSPFPHLLPSSISRPVLEVFTRQEFYCFVHCYGHHQMVNTEIRFIIFFAAKDGEALYSQEKQDQELTMATIMNSLLPNSDSN